VIQLRNIKLELSGNEIFKNINCTLHTDNRVGVIGRNGAGKSTLLKLISGKIKPDAGTVCLEKGLRIGYIPQDEILVSSLSIFDEAFSAHKEFCDIEHKIEQIEQELKTSPSPQRAVELVEAYDELQDKRKQYDKHILIEKTKEKLAGLGFSQEMITQPVEKLSTGWKIRLSLAKLLLSDADILLFDEPTNHLDIVTQQWLLETLKAMPQGFLMVSHDQAYLEQVCSHILEIEMGVSTYYTGNLSSYLTQKQEQQEIARSTRARQDREIEQKQAIVNRFKASASRGQQAKNMQKQIDRMELVEVASPLPTIHFKFPVPPRSGKVALTFNNIGYSFEQRQLFKGLSGEIATGERVALIAANGVGKTTLLNCLTGKYNPQEGSVTLGNNVKIAFFEQEQSRVLSPEKTIIDELLSTPSQATEAEIRKLLGSFQYTGDDVYKKIKVLSGGEKNRVAMVKILIQNANLLILDEPTNHLDIYSKDILRQALQAYQGTILFVSHDLHFVNSIAKRIIKLTPTEAHTYLGTYEEFCTQQAQAQAQTATSPSKPETSTHKKRLTELEREISRLELSEKKEADKLANSEYGTPEYQKSIKSITEIQKNLSKLQKEWEAVMAVYH